MYKKSKMVPNKNFNLFMLIEITVLLAIIVSKKNNMTPKVVNSNPIHGEVYNIMW
jgi:hypothetical protein